MWLAIDDLEGRKFPLYRLNGQKIKKTQKNLPNFLNGSVVVPGPSATYPHLQRAVNRQPDYRPDD